MASKFQQRHYEAIAELMQRVYRAHDFKGDQVVIDCVRQELADMFAGDNGMFKRDRFERACVPGANVRARS